MEYSKLIEELSNNLKEKYNEYLDNRNEYLDSRIIRKINLTMSNACENEIALLVSKVLNKDYNIIIDAYLSYTDENAKKRKNKTYRPDIIVIKTCKEHDNIVNEIVGIIEVKAQMGYTGILTPDMYEYRLDRLKGNSICFSDEEYELLSKDALKYYGKMGLTNEHKAIDYRISDNLNIFVVNVMASNHSSNVEDTIACFDKKKSKVHFYTIYDNHIWYNKLSSEKLFELNKDEKLIDKEVKIIKINKNGLLEEQKKKISFKINKKVREEHGISKFIDDIKGNIK